jgi:hypothetical protein
VQPTFPSYTNPFDLLVPGISRHPDTTLPNSTVVNQGRLRGLFRYCLRRLRRSNPFGFGQLLVGRAPIRFLWDCEVLSTYRRRLARTRVARVAGFESLGPRCWTFPERTDVTTLLRHPTANFAVSDGPDEDDRGLFTLQILYADRTTITQASSTRYLLRVVTVVVVTVTSFTVVPNSSCSDSTC